MSCFGFEEIMKHWAVLVLAGLLLQAQGVLFIRYCNEEAENYKEMVDRFPTLSKMAVVQRQPFYYACCGLFMGGFGLIMFTSGIVAVVRRLSS
jgi:hypothetical protein